MRELWQDYKFLSKELYKFTSAEDISLFEDLLNQREVLLSIIKEADDADGYIKSSDGQAFIKSIVDLDEGLKEKMIVSRNLLKKNMEISSAYEGFIGESATIGSMFDSSKR